MNINAALARTPKQHFFPLIFLLPHNKVSPSHTGKMLVVPPLHTQFRNPVPFPQAQKTFCEGTMAFPHRETDERETARTA